MSDLATKIKTFPNKPGVYIMRSPEDKVIYVGKAINLKKRVSNYFGKSRDKRPQIDTLMKTVSKIEYIVTKTEKEALLLELNLIQEHKPRYNIIFKDNKRYVSIKITSYHKFPGIYVTRTTPADNSTYFGPYTNSMSCRKMVELIINYFKIRNCKDNFFSNRSRPCIQYDIKRCSGPCVGLISQKDYKKSVESGILFLKGKVSNLLRSLKAEMKKASESTNYEEAAHLRDVIKGIKTNIESQRIAEYTEKNKDYIGCYQEGNKTALTILESRAGQIKGYNNLSIKNELGETEAFLEQLLLQYYKNQDLIPAEIFLDQDVGSMNLLEAILTDRKGKLVKIKHPLRGKEAKRVALAKENAKEYHLKQEGRSKKWPGIKLELEKKLGLKDETITIECLDISNISGKYAVGSLVSFKNDKPNKDGYRKYKIITKDTPDDYAMMYEVLTRRFSGKKEHPNLLLIDGGKGHLMIAVKVLEELEIKDVSLASIAKDRIDKTDRIFVPNRKNPIGFKKNSDPLLYLQKIRDEAHRFGITYYRDRHRKDLITSLLDKIAGLGPRKRKDLLAKFGSIEKIKSATSEEISTVKGITEKLAKEILKVLNKK